MTLRITIGSDGQGTTLRLSGRIRSTDIQNVREAMKGKAERIVLDLEEVTLVDLDVVRLGGE
jgi:anti-anti-sigma regulatory factor